MNKQQESTETILKRYRKANSSYKQSILRKYGIKKIEDVCKIMDIESDNIQMSKTALAAFILNNKGVEMEISFQKQVKEDEVLRDLMYTYRNVAPYQVESAFKKTLSIALRGVETTRRIIHNSKFDIMKRLFATDLDKEQKVGQASSSKMILISLDKVNWVKVNGITYIKKD